MAIELRNRLESDLEIPLSPVVIWSHPAPRLLAEFLAGKLRESETEKAFQSEEERLLETIEGMSEEEAAYRLTESEAKKQ